MDEQWKPMRDDELPDDERLPFPLGVPERVKQENQQVIDKLLKPHRAARAFGDVLDNRKTVGDVMGIASRCEPLSAASRWPFGQDGLRNEPLPAVPTGVELLEVGVADFLDCVDVSVKLVDEDARGPMLHEVLSQPGCIDALVGRLRLALFALLDEDGEACDS